MPKLMTEKFAILLLASCLGVLVCAQAQSDRAVSSELQRATETGQHISSTARDKGVPNDVLHGAKCVAVIPKLVKGAFVVGGEHGSGVATCKTSSATWSAPAPFSVSGVSWGPQIGGRAPTS